MFTTKISPRFGDMDALHHINNTTLALWFEVARNPLFRMFDPELKLNLDTWPLIMAHTDYDFVGELFLQPDVEIRSWIDRIGNKSFTVYHEAWQNDKLCVTGRAVIVHYDFINKKTTPLSDNDRAMLSQHLRDPEGN